MSVPPKTAILYGFPKDGGFVAGNVVTGLIAYAYPSSDAEQRARRDAPSVAREMVSSGLFGHSICTISTGDPEHDLRTLARSCQLVADGHARRWAMLADPATKLSVLKDVASD